MRWLPFVFLLVIAVPQAHAWSWPWTGFVKAEVAAVKNEFQGKVAGVEGELNGIKGDVNGIKTANIKLAEKIDSVASANAKVNVGYQQGNTDNTAGRDLIQANRSKVTNDSGLMNSIFKAATGSLVTIVMALIGFIKMQSKQLKEAREQLGKLLTERDQNYEELVAWQLAYFQKALTAKDDYKAKYITMLQEKAGICSK